MGLCKMPNPFTFRKSYKIRKTLIALNNLSPVQLFNIFLYHSFTSIVIFKFESLFFDFHIIISTTENSAFPSMYSVLQLYD